MQILLALAAIAAIAEPVSAQEPLVTFEKSPALDLEGVKVEVSILRPPNSGPLQYAFKQTIVGRNGEKRGQPYYTDTLYCPQALRALQQLSDLPGPQPGLVGLEKNPPKEIIVDGTGYRLSVATALPYLQGHMTLSSNIGTPLAQWVDEALKTLEPCWRPTQLKL